jgi:hypothetical protein
VVVCALVASVGLPAACKQTVTGPSDVHLQIDVGSGGSGSGGAIRINAATCACLPTLVILIDGARAGTMACNDERTFAAAAGQHTVAAADSSGKELASATVTVTATAGAVARISCA